MQIRFSENAYYRCVENTSLLWHKRNCACMILEDAELFLGELDWQFKETDSIVQKIAERCNVDFQEVNGDFQVLCQSLLENGLLVTRNAREVEGGVSPASLEMAAAQRQTGMDLKKNDDWTPLGDFFRKFRIPCELHLDLTSACTERCVHCYIPEYANRFLDFSLVKKALDEFKAMGGLTVHLSGGECMMHPEFDRIIRYCREQNINMIILSNLTLCDDEKIKVLKEVDPQFVNVSLYSMNPLQHDAVTSLPASWRRTMDAILKCEENGVHIRLAAPVLKENKEGYGALRKFAEEHHMHLIPDVDIFPQCDHDDSNMEHALSPGELKQFLQENRELFKSLLLPGKMPSCDAKVCDIGESRICLDSQGHYYPCDGTHGLILGDVRADTLDSVWNGEKFNALRKLKNRDFVQCRDCENRPYCKVCPAHNFNATGDVLKHTSQKCAFAIVKRQVFGGENASSAF